MCVLYLTRHDCRVNKDGGQLVVRENGSRLAAMPLKMVSTVVVAANVQLTTQVILALMKNNISITYADWRGRWLGMTSGCRANEQILQKQLQYANDEEYRLSLARYVISRKLAAQLAILRDYAKHRQSITLKTRADELAVYRTKLAAAARIDELRGLEGICSKMYFAAFAELTDAAEWGWQGRSRQPADDALNALLNYGYAFLERDVRLAIMGSGMDERIGFLHSNNGRKDSLVYDFMEMFRQSVIDRLVLRLVNRHSIKTSDFQQTENGWLLTDEGRRSWINFYEAYMENDESASRRSCLRREIFRFRCKFLSADRAQLAG